MRSLLTLPGYHYPGNEPDGFMKRDAIVEYIKDYAKSFDPPIKERVEVFSVKKHNSGLFELDTSIGSYTADQVVVATMVPVHNNIAAKSPYIVETYHGTSLRKNNRPIASIQFPDQPKFYNLKTAEGIPYSQIALQHSHNVLATTVLQTCIRYSNRNTACQFCAIEQSLAAGKTIAQKTPAQLAEVAEAAVRLDGVEQLVMTTGTPNTTDRGAAYLIKCAQAVKARVNLPIQAQCEPPNDFGWFAKMKSDYQFKLALSDAEIEAYFSLRQLIFCQEQGIFETSDRDEYDDFAYPIIAVNHESKVVGVVRIYEPEPGLWYGGRLGTHPDYRRGWKIGKGLIDKAVTTAHTWGCDRFLARVQLPNVRFFQRLHWNSVEEINICDRPHNLMEAELDFYPPTSQIRPSVPIQLQQLSAS